MNVFHFEIANIPTTKRYLDFAYLEIKGLNSRRIFYIKNAKIKAKILDKDKSSQYEIACDQFL